jgi:hypothetical protein
LIPPDTTIGVENPFRVAFPRALLGLTEHTGWTTHRPEKQGQHLLVDRGRCVAVLSSSAPDQAAAETANPAQRGYRSSRLTSTVSTTEATTENSTMNKQPSPPPSGRISRFPKRMPDDLPPTRTANHRAGRALWTPHQTPISGAGPTVVTGGLVAEGAASHGLDHPV